MFLQCPPSIWDKIFEINVKNALQLTQLVVPHMQKRKGGAIVYVSSIAGYQPFSVSLFFDVLISYHENTVQLTQLFSTYLWWN